jgi:DNA repair protein SbcC/Rad50
MIKRLELTNFQNHEHSVFDFCPGVNIITGPSDNGKSSIVRAIRWVLTNKPQGDGFVRTGTDETNITLTTTDDVTIARGRTKKANYYELKGETFKAMRGAVPGEIEAALDIGPANLQMQVTPHYLLTMSPGDVARHINEIADLTIIDESARKANNLISVNAQNIKGLEDAIAGAEEGLKQYDSLPAIVTLVRRIGVVAERQETLRKCIEGITTILKNVADINHKLCDLDVLLRACTVFEQLQAALPPYIEQQRKYTVLSSLIATIKDGKVLWEGCKDATLGFEAQLTALDSVRPAILQLEKHYAEVTELMNSCANIDRCTTRLTELAQTIITIQKDVDTMRGTLPLCPTCGAIMDKPLDQ